MLPGLQPQDKGPAKVCPLEPKVLAEIAAACQHSPQATVRQLAKVLPFDYKLEALSNGKDMDTAYASRLFRVCEIDASLSIADHCSLSLPQYNLLKSHSAVSASKFVHALHLLLPL